MMQLRALQNQRSSIFATYTYAFVWFLYSAPLMFPAHSCNFTMAESFSLSDSFLSLSLSLVGATAGIWRGYLSPTDDFH